MVSRAYFTKFMQFAEMQFISNCYTLVSFQVMVLLISFKTADLTNSNVWSAPQTPSAFLGRFMSFPTYYRIKRRRRS